MGTVHSYAAFAEAMNNYRAGAAFAAGRGDDQYARACQAAADDLARKVAPPKLIPDGIDKVIELRRQAGDMADHVRLETELSFTIVRRQEEFARRLGAIAARRAQA